MAHEITKRDHMFAVGATPWHGLGTVLPHGTALSSAQAIAAALEIAIRNPALRQKLGDAAEERVRREFDHNTSIRQLKTLFENEWKAA